MKGWLAKGQRTENQTNHVVATGINRPVTVTIIYYVITVVACSKRSDSGERCRVKKAIKSRGGLGREGLSPLPLPRFYFLALLFTSHRSPLSERLEQAITVVENNKDIVKITVHGELNIYFSFHGK